MTDGNETALMNGLSEETLPTLRTITEYSVMNGAGCPREEAVRMAIRQGQSAEAAQRAVVRLRQTGHVYQLKGGLLRPVSEHSEKFVKEGSIDA